MSCTLAEVVSTVWIKPDSLYTPILTFIPKCHRLLFFVCCISGSRTSGLFCGTGSGDQRCVKDCALLHGHQPLLDVGLCHVGDFLAQVVILGQVSAAENCCLIRDPTTVQIDSSETPNGVHFIWRILHEWITEAEPLLH